MGKHDQEDPEDHAKKDGQVDPGTIIDLDVDGGKHAEDEDDE